MILAANFKMNHTRASTKEYLAKLQECSKPENLDLFVFPPFTALDRYESVLPSGPKMPTRPNMAPIPARSVCSNCKSLVSLL